MRCPEYKYVFNVALESSRLPSVTVSTGTDSLPVVSIQVSLSLGGIPGLVSVSAFVMDFKELSAYCVAFPG